MEFSPLYILVVCLISGSIILPLWYLVRQDRNRLDSSWRERLQDKESEIDRQSAEHEKRIEEKNKEVEKSDLRYTQEVGKNFSILANQQAIIELMDASLLFQKEALKVIDRNTAAVSELGTIISSNRAHSTD